MYLKRLINDLIMKKLVKKIKHTCKIVIRNIAKTCMQLFRYICNLCKIIVRPIYRFFINIVYCYCYPSAVIRKLSIKSRWIILAVLSIIFLASGIILNQIWKFNYFFIYIILFYIILVGVVCAEFIFVKSTDKIRALTIGMNGFIKANTFFSKYETSKIYALIPPLVVIIFGFSGTFLFKQVIITPTLIWVLCFFAVVVHLSIIGYLQYVLLFIYIGKIAKDKSNYINLIKPTQHVIPTEIDWLLGLTKLYHVFRSAFFTFGSLFIAAYSCFCFLPGFGVDVNNHLFFLLWTIIFIAIVVLFPLTSILKYQWIKKIVKKVKKSYIDDLKNETLLAGDKIPEWYNTSLQMISNLFTVTVNNLDDYPFKNKAGEVYAYLIAVINFVASIGTAIQFISRILSLA